MNETTVRCTPVPTFLIPNVMSQPSFNLQHGTIVQAIPVQCSGLEESTAKTSDFASDGSPETGSFMMETNIPSVKPITKGRRPKGIGIELTPSSDEHTVTFPERPMCRACGKYFMSRQQLNQHMLVHTDVRKYRCTYCDRSFKQPSHLHQHHRIHTGEKPYSCPMPGCSRAFPQQSNLNHHLRNHDKPPPPPENTCTLCMRTYASETVLRSHITRIHFCDPNTLLGDGNSKPQKKNVCMSSTVETPTSTNKLTFPYNVKLTETNNTEQIVKIEPNEQQENTSNTTNKDVSMQTCTNIFNNNFTTKYLERLQAQYASNYAVDKADESDDNRPAYTEASAGRSDSDLNCGKALDKKQMIGINQKRNEFSYNYTLDEADDNLLQHFIVTTTNGRALNTSNINATFDTKTNEQTNVSDNGLISDSSVCRYVSSSGTSQPSEGMNITSGRSRKRKAFHPQRIVHNVEFE